MSRQNGNHFKRLGSDIRRCGIERRGLNSKIIFGTERRRRQKQGFGVPPAKQGLPTISTAFLTIFCKEQSEQLKCEGWDLTYRHCQVFW